jgi:hypothetical protein
MSLWPDVERHLFARETWFKTEPRAAHLVIEGRVHAAMCSGVAASNRVINPETSPSFRDQGVKDAICGRIRTEIRRVLDGVSDPKA